MDTGREQAKRVMKQEASDAGLMFDLVARMNLALAIMVGLFPNLLSPRESLPEIKRKRFEGSGISDSSEPAKGG
uniref:Uncharacterized protein n=1 Tax=Oryza nivara TaxID=4536 RepID=A0A0E0G136_ORYNI